MRKAAFLMMAMVMLASCRAANLYYVTPPGPPEYQLGWQDGCDTGISAQSGVFSQLLFGFKKRPEMTGSTTYTGAWNDGFTYCRFATAAEPSGNWLSGTIN